MVHFCDPFYIGGILLAPNQSQSKKLFMQQSIAAAAAVAVALLTNLTFNAARRNCIQEIIPWTKLSKTSDGNIARKGRA